MDDLENINIREYVRERNSRYTQSRGVTQAGADLRQALRAATFYVVGKRTRRGPPTPYHLSCNGMLEDHQARKK
jgi:hypothetical protein